MLHGDFYSIRTTEVVHPENHRFLVSINPAHQIFNGHFPGQPVVPGVCLIQIVKELMETMAKRKLFLEKGSSIKFLHVVDPMVNPSIWFDVRIKNTSSEIVNTDIIVSFESTTFFKFSGQFR